MKLNLVAPALAGLAVLVSACASASPQAITGAELSPSDTYASTAAQPSANDSTTLGATSPASADAGIPTALLVDNRIIDYLNGISMFKMAPTEFGGVVNDTASGRAIVYVSTKVDPAVAATDLGRYVNEAITWINHSVVDINNRPVISTVPPTTPVFLVVSDLTYQDFFDIEHRLTTEAWTTDAQTRVVGFGADYVHRRENVTIVGLTPADVAAANAAFGDRVSLVDGTAADSLTATVPIANP